MCYFFSNTDINQIFDQKRVPPLPRHVVEHSPFESVGATLFFSLLRPSKIHRKQTGGKVCCCTPPSSSGSCAMFVIGSVNIYPRKKNPSEKTFLCGPPSRQYSRYDDGVWIAQAHTNWLPQTRARAEIGINFRGESFTTQGGKNSQFDPCPRLRKKRDRFPGCRSLAQRQHSQWIRPVRSLDGICLGRLLEPRAWGGLL